MSYRVRDANGRLGPHVAGEPPESLRNLVPPVLADCLGGDWLPPERRSAKVRQADAVVEAKLSNGGILPDARHDRDARRVFKTSGRRGDYCNATDGGER